MTSRQTENLTRRRMLSVTLGAAGLAVLGGRTTFGASAPSGMKIGCGTVTFRKLPLVEAMERIRRAGYEYIEPQATGPWCPHVDAWKDDPEQFRRRLTQFGFKGATALWAPQGAIIPNAKSVEGITQAIRWAKEAGIPVVNAGDGRRPDGMTEEDALAVLRDRLAQILEVAAQCQVYLAIEPHGSFSLTSDGLQKILALSNSPWLAINYDTANVHRATYVETINGGYSWVPYGRRQDEVATLKTVVSRVVHVHVKDVVGAKCVALGQGKVNVRACIDVLRQHGYQGVLSLETEGEFDADEGQRLIEASRRYLVETLAT